nr:hypothetical protein [Schlegelella koreensis]
MEPFTYKGYRLTVTSVALDTGFKASVAIVGLEGGRLRSQRFLDVEPCDEEADAIASAVVEAEAWIDREGGAVRSGTHTGFLPLD